MKKVWLVSLLIITLVLSDTALAQSRHRHHRHRGGGDDDSGPRSVPSRMSTGGESEFVFFPRARMWGAYTASGNLVNSGVANGGNSYCPDLHRSCFSPRGTFRIHDKGGSDCRSTKFPLGRGGAPMPYCMYFHGGYAIHGYPHLTSSNVSHGCIRISTDSARWLSNSFLHVGSKVVVVGY